MKRSLVLTALAALLGFAQSRAEAQENQATADSIQTRGIIQEAGAPWSLEQCMRYAVGSSPAVVRGQLAVANLRADQTQAILNHLPSLGASVGASANFGRNINPADNSYTTVSTFSNSYNLSAGMTLFNGLSLLNNTRIARLSKLRGEQDQERIEDEVSLQTMQAYFDLAYAIRSAELAREQLETSRATERQTRRMLELGMRSAAELAQIEAELANQVYNLTRMENTRRTMELRLKEAMNFPLDDELQIDPAVAYAAPLPETTDIQELIASALDFLPRAQMAGMDVRMHRINYRGSYWRLLPSISASGGLGTNYYTNLTGGAVGAPFSDQFRDNYSKGFSASASIPIFQSWDRSMNIIRSRNNLRSMELARTQTERAIAVEVEQAVLDLNGALAEREQALKQVRARELAYRAAQHRYNEGMLSIIDLQTTSNQLLSARAALLSAELTWQGKRKLVDYYKGIPLLAAF